MKHPSSITQLLILPSALAHSRWSCPQPRSPSTGIKQGPCGSDTNDFDNPLLSTTDGDGSIVEIKPGPLRVSFEESIHHTGAPFRISLSNDGNDDDSCVLLDHIPHNDCCSPRIYDPTTYTPYAITINIPNVICERCSLHLANPMTDKIGSNGSPSGIGCTDPGSCFSVYHSCTKPFRIVGNVDGGAVQRSEYSCPSVDSFNPGWPSVWTGDNGEDVDASTPGVYRRESSVWSVEDYTLETAPAKYRDDTGGLCGNKSEIVSNNETDSKDPAASLIPASSTSPTPGPFLPVTHSGVMPASSTGLTAGPTVSTKQTNDLSPQTASPTAMKEIADEAIPSQTSSSATTSGLSSSNVSYILISYIMVAMFFVLFHGTSR